MNANYNLDPKELHYILGRNIRAFRKERDLTIRELSQKARLNPCYLGDVERGRRNPSLSNIGKIANGLGTRPETLLMKEGNAPAAGISAREKALSEIVALLREAAGRDTRLYPEIIRLITACVAKM